MPLWRRAGVYRCSDLDQILINKIAERFENMVSKLQSESKIPGNYGRPTLGQFVSIHSLQAKLIPTLLLTPGMEVALYQAGLCWGRAAGEVMIKNFGIKNVEEFIDCTKQVTEVLGLQIPELVDVRKGENGNITSVTVRLYECSDCYGVPKINMPLCYFETGKWTGGLEVLSGKSMEGTERKCPGLGDEFCEIQIREKKM